MADRNRDEIQGIIDAAEAKIEPHKALAYWVDGAPNGKPRPPGHSPNTVAQAHRAIAQARAQISKDIASACARHRAEANALPPVADKNAA